MNDDIDVAAQADLARLQGRCEELERQLAAARTENDRHQTVNLIRFVYDPLWEQKDGWIADYIAREDFDAIPWRVAQSQQRLAARYGDALVRIRTVILNDEFTSIDDIAREALEGR